MNKTATFRACTESKEKNEMETVHRERVRPRRKRSNATAWLCILIKYAGRQASCAQRALSPFPFCCHCFPVQPPSRESPWQIRRDTNSVSAFLQAHFFAIFGLLVSHVVLHATTLSQAFLLAQHGRPPRSAFHWMSQHASLLSTTAVTALVAFCSSFYSRLANH